MKLYERVFVNPLLALAFKDGVEFLDDPDYKVLEPKQEGPTKWTVLIEHEDGEDDVPGRDDDTIIGEYTETGFSPVITKIAEPAKTLKDYEERFNKMKPVIAKSKGEIIHPPVKISGEEIGIEVVRPSYEELYDEALAQGLLNSKKNKSTDGRCGECIPCNTGHDCMRLINEALKNMPQGRER